VGRRKVEPFLREVEWSTLGFFMGLFVVSALVKADVVVQVAHAVAGRPGEPVGGQHAAAVDLGGAVGDRGQYPYVATPPR
jgi:Na+/H+ antiporter NhaD/arsenite permease-like protein